ncbi:MAG: HAD family hydrolase [Gammaproteobacteria bacterium]|nr:MAG: HAD family hydrolase [Gammaproteobacteria bacterium]
MIEAVFFDLDGTLLDTARDMAGALNRLLVEQGQPPLDYDLIRSEVSHGARAMIHLGFDVEDEDSDRFQQLRQRFLDIYQDNIANETTLFPHMDTILELLETQRIPWGVVTNKPSWLTLPLLEQLLLAKRAATIICADTAGVSKPNAKPVMDACEAVDVDPARAIYVGDDERDVMQPACPALRCVAVISAVVRMWMTGERIWSWILSKNSGTG